MLKNKIDGELHYIIKAGKGRMPEEGDRASEEALWHLVSYIRSLSVGASTPDAAPAAQ